MLPFSNPQLSGISRLYESFCEEFKPSSTFEELLVLKLAKCTFKMRRVDILEKSQIDQELISFQKTCSLSFKEAPKMDLVLRYKRSIEGEFYRALSVLRKLNDEKISC